MGYFYGYDRLHVKADTFHLWVTVMVEECYGIMQVNRSIRQRDRRNIDLLLLLRSKLYLNGEPLDVIFGVIFGEIFGVIFGVIFGEIFGVMFGEIFG